MVLESFPPVACARLRITCVLLAAVSALMTACVPVSRTECHFMVHTERARCLRMHDSNDRAMAERRARQRSAPPVELTGAAVREDYSRREVMKSVLLRDERGDSPMLQPGTGDSARE